VQVDLQRARFHYPHPWCRYIQQASAGWKPAEHDTVKHGAKRFKSGGEKGALARE
jgi:hypothetical protein